MKYSNSIRLFVVLTTTTIISSCAHYHSIKPVSGYSYKKQTPTQTINNYKIESQKRDLDSVISGRQLDKPEFLKEIHNKKVAMWVKYFSGRGKERFERYLKNGEKYRPLIESTFDDYGLPKELYFVGLIESGYYLKAKSHANAVGPWQFIKDTAKRYGLNVRRGVDERQSIVKATKAAALFFQDLYNIFGSWELALSAYNAGEYGIIRRIRKANTRDYYELSAQKKIPKETRHYVPKVIAAMKVYQNARRYGINIPQYRNNVYANLEEVKLYRSTSLKNLSRKTKVPLATIRQLNPDIKWAHTPRLRNGFTVVLPKNQAQIQSLAKLRTEYPLRKSKSERAHRRVASTKRKTKDYINYKVRRGDNLYTIARKNHTHISKILKMNRLKKRTIYVGQRLKLPKIDMETYIVKRGDYLLKIAKRHNLTVRKLKKLNGMRTSKIYPGQRLIVSVN